MLRLRGNHAVNNRTGVRASSIHIPYNDRIYHRPERAERKRLVVFICDSGGISHDEKVVDSGKFVIVNDIASKIIPWICVGPRIPSRAVVARSVN